MRSLSVFTEFVASWMWRGGTGACALLLGAVCAHAGIPVEHWRQPDGVKVYLVSNPAIPMVDVQIDLDAGGRRDPVHQAGLASIMASMSGKGLLAVGSHPALDENGLSDAWADLGASFGASAGMDRLSFALRSITDADVLPKALLLAARQIAAPAFPEDVWQRERKRMESDWKEANTRPATHAARAFGRLVYGAHPYGFDSDPGHWSRISGADLRVRYAQSVLPCRAKVSIVGAVTREQAKEMVKTLFSLTRQNGSLLKDQDCAAAADRLAATLVPEVAALEAARELRMPFESAQAHVLMGQPGYKRSDPDFFALLVGNHILGGGGFTSRLTEQVREKRGLTYSVYSYFSPALHAGAFTIGLQTRPDQADQAVKISREVLQEFVHNGPTAAEVQAAKANLVGGFALRIDTNRKLLDNIANMAWNDLPLDYLDTWTSQIERLEPAGIKAALQRKLTPSRLVTIVVGGSRP